MTDRDIVRSTQFKRDAKLAFRRYGSSLGDELARIIQRLVDGETLDQRNRDHTLTGWNPPARECHIRPDVLLVYRLSDTTVELVRMGSHSDLF